MKLAELKDMVKTPKKTSLVDEIILLKKAQPKTVAELTAEMGGAKRSGKEFFKVRGLVGDLFAQSWVGVTAWKDAAVKNRIMNDNVAAEKFGGYDAEFQRLFNAIQDTFRNKGRNDLANDFAGTVGGFDSKQHPIDYLATLLKGSGNPQVQKINELQYSILEPWKGDMSAALKAKGVAAPDAIDDLTQVFYNKFVADEESVKNFDELLPSEMYHLDDAVVNATVTYLKTLADQKKQGEVLPKALDKLASTTIKVENQLKDVATEEVNKEVGGFVLGNSKYLIIGAVVLVIIIAVLLLRK